MHVHITDSTQRRWEVPQSLIPRPAVTSSPTRRRNDENPRQLELSYTVEPFGFAITRIATGECLFNSTPPTDEAFNAMVFKDQYLEISTQLPGKSSSLFGIGESTRPDGLRLTRNRTYTLWATDVAASNVDVDLYGAYPFHMDVRNAGATHGVLLLNSNGMTP